MKIRKLTGDLKHNMNHWIDWHHIFLNLSNIKIVV